MIQPGRETNIPTSSGSVRGGSSGSKLGTPLLKLDGFTVTIGTVLILILAFLIYQSFFKRKRR